MRNELLEETPTHGQRKWERERALRAVENYDRFLRAGEGRSLVEYWRDLGEELEFIRKSATGTVEPRRMGMRKKCLDRRPLATRTEAFRAEIVHALSKDP